MLSNMSSVLRGTKDERDKIPLLCKLGTPSIEAGFAADFSKLRQAANSVDRLSRRLTNILKHSMIWRGTGHHLARSLRSQPQPSYIMFATGLRRMTRRHDANAQLWHRLTFEDRSTAHRRPIIESSCRQAEAS